MERFNYSDEILADWRVGNDLHHALVDRIDLLPQSESS
jgi:hypothetical protein